MSIHTRRDCFRRCCFRRCCDYLFQRPRRAGLSSALHKHERNRPIDLATHRAWLAKPVFMISRCERMLTDALYTVRRQGRELLQCHSGPDPPGYHAPKDWHPVRPHRHLYCEFRHLSRPTNCWTLSHTSERFVQQRIGSKQACSKYTAVMLHDMAKDGKTIRVQSRCSTTFLPMQDGIGFAYQGHKIVIGLAEEDDAVTGMASCPMCAAAHACHIT